MWYLLLYLLIGFLIATIYARHFMNHMTAGMFIGAVIFYPLHIITDISLLIEEYINKYLDWVRYNKNIAYRKSNK